MDSLTPDLRVLSLGGGVQSTALSLMAEAGLIGEGEKPDVAFFADTGWEPPHVYETVEAVAEIVSYPVKTVSNGRNLARDVYDGVAGNGNRFIPIPVFLTSEDGKKGMNVRQCTIQYKIDPINRAIREWMGVATRKWFPKGVIVEQWMGISTDEAWRIKPNGKPYIMNRFPLVDQGFSRLACVLWLGDHFPDVPVGKSACMGCPYHSQEAWVELAAKYPKEFGETVEIDRQLRKPGHNDKSGEVFLHKHRLPLEEAVHMDLNTPSLFGEECGGYCGI